MASIPAAPLLSGKQESFTLPLTDHAGQPVGHYHKTKKTLDQGTLWVKVQYIPAEKFVSS
jgi:hypothetical protein